MKKLAVFGSGYGSNFEAIVEYFKGKDVEITCVSDKLDSFILERAKMSGIKNFFIPFDETSTFLKGHTFDLVALAGYMRILPPEILKMSKFINIHPSLLPAFKGKNAQKQAYDAGVKVSGVTIHYVNETVDEGEIIAQYPVFLEEDMNLNDFTNALHYVEHKIYPHVIESLLFDKYVDVQSVMSNRCGGGCSGCQH